MASPAPPGLSHFFNMEELAMAQARPAACLPARRLLQRRPSVRRNGRTVAEKAAVDKHVNTETLNVVPFLEMQYFSSEY